MEECVQVFTGKSRGQSSQQIKDWRQGTTAFQQEFEFKHETESIMRRTSNSSESHVNGVEHVKTPTLEGPSSVPLQDGLYVDSTFNFQHMLTEGTVVLKRPKVS